MSQNTLDYIEKEIEEGRVSIEDMRQLKMIFDLKIQIYEEEQKMKKSEINKKLKN